MKRFLLSVTLAAALLAWGTLSSVAQKRNIEKKIVRVTKGGEGAWLGVLLKDITHDLVEEDSLKTESGAYVDEVIDDSPADSAGIKEGDVIVEFNRQPVKSADDLVSAVKKLKQGEKATVTVMRDGEKKSMAVVLGKNTEGTVSLSRKFVHPMPAMPPRPPSVGSIPERGLMRMFGGHQETYGMRLMPLEEQLAAYFGAPNNKGILVEHVDKDSKAEKAGFKAGDVIMRAGKKTIADVEDFRTVLRAFDKGEKIPIEILRRGTRETLSVEAPDDQNDASEFMYQQFGPSSGSGQHFFHQFSPGTMKFWSDNGKDGGDIDLNVDLDAMKSYLEQLKKSLPDIRIETNGDAPRIHKNIRIVTSPDEKDI